MIYESDIPSAKPAPLFKEHDQILSIQPATQRGLDRVTSSGHDRHISSATRHPQELKCLLGNLDKAQGIDGVT
jgi:hypothetical protein